MSPEAYWGLAIFGLSLWVAAGGVNLLLHKSGHKKTARNNRHTLTTIYGLTAVSLLSVLLCSGCATTVTRNHSEDGATQTLIRAEFGGRILNHGATASYTGPGWSMEAGDTAEEVSADPETVRAITEGITAGVVQSIKRLGWIP